MEYLRRNVGARPWQILFKPRPEPPVMSAEEAPQFGEMPPWEVWTITDTVLLGPTIEWGRLGAQVKRIARAVAVDMASVKLRPFDSEEAVEFLGAVERYTNLLITYPYAGSQRLVKEEAANEILETWNIWTLSGSLHAIPLELGYGGEALWSVRSPAYAASVAAVHLATNNGADAAIRSSIAALADFELGVGLRQWPFRTHGEAAGFEENLNYWIGVWWEEVKNVLAFRGWGTRLL